MEYSTETVKSLKIKLKSRGLSQKGKKSELIERLEAADTPELDDDDTEDTVERLRKIVEEEQSEPLSLEDLTSRFINLERDFSEYKDLQERRKEIYNSNFGQIMRSLQRYVQEIARLRKFQVRVMKACQEPPDDTQPLLKA